MFQKLINTNLLFLLAWMQAPFESWPCMSFQFVSEEWQQVKNSQQKTVRVTYIRWCKKNIPPFQDIPNSTTPAQKTWKFIIQPRDMFLVMITKIAKFLWFWIYLLLARSQKKHLGVKLQFNSIGHVNNIPTMQFYTGISRVTQSTS